MTSECYSLKRQIEALIQRGELKEFVLRMISAVGPTTNRPQSGKGGGIAASVDRTVATVDANPQLHVVTIILGGPKDGDSAQQRKKFLRAVAQEDTAIHVHFTYEEPSSVPHEMMYFTNEEAKRVMHPHNDAIVIW